MSFGSAPKQQQLAMPPPAAHPATLGSINAQMMMQSKKNASSSAGAGFQDTIKTSSQGVTEKATTAKATLLGQ